MRAPLRPIVAGALGLGFAAALAMSAPASIEDYADGLKGPAARAVDRYLHATYEECVVYTEPAPPKPRTYRELHCPLAQHTESLSISYGRFPHDSHDYAVAFIAYAHDVSAQVLYRFAIVFRRGASGTYAAVGRTIAGGAPLRVRFGPNHTISYVGLSVGPKDATCCPTRKDTYKVVVGDRGVRSVDPWGR